LLLALGAPLTAMADSMRCGKWIVGDDSTPAEVLQKCGPPQEQDKTTEPAFGRNPAGVTVKTGTSTTERWYYQPGSRAFRMVVTIVDGDLKHIERAPDAVKK
jgi:hypothetical protein